MSASIPGRSRPEPDPHRRAEDLFDGLIAEATIQDTRLLLEGMKHLAMLLVEVQVGQNPKFWTGDH